MCAALRPQQFVAQKAPLMRVVKVDRGRDIASSGLIQIRWDYMDVKCVETAAFLGKCHRAGAFKITRIDDSNLCWPNGGDTIKVFLQVSTSPWTEWPGNFSAALMRTNAG